MVEPEIAFADIHDNADVAEALLKHAFGAVLARRPDDMAFFAERIDKDAITRLESLVTSEFVRMTYTEAIAVLERAKRAWEFPVSWGVALQAEHERYLCEDYAKRPVVVIDYPKEIKAFYMRLNDDDRTVAAMDVLAPGIGEIIGGSQREDDYELLLQRIIDQGLDPEAYRWYLDLRKYGTFVHSGFGLGVERTVAWICGIPHIREAIAFPRQLHRLYP
jgi:asparaginyl-tRNA synthetase